MSKFYNIKWRTNDETEARRVLKNFNAKVRREIAKNPSNKSALPQFFNEKTGEWENRLTYENFKSMIGTRADFNRELNSLKRFSKRGAEQIVNIPGNYNDARTTRWQAQEMTRRSAIINQKREVRREKKSALETIDTLGKTGFTYGQAYAMGLISDNDLKPTTAYTKGMRQEDVKHKYRSLQIGTQQQYYNKKDLQLKENFIKGLKETWSEDEVKEIVAKIRAMDLEEFITRFDRKAGNAMLDIYFPDEDSRSDYLTELKNYWLGNMITEY